MVDVTLTPASVIAGANAQRVNGISGVAILAGQLIYKDKTTTKYLLADSNAADPLARIPAGVALHGSSPNQPIALQTSGDITIGGTLIAGTDYFLSGTPGGLCPRADVVATMNVTLIGLAKSTTVLAIDIQASGVTL